jgi:gliding motility-associated-like protein
LAAPVDTQRIIVAGKTIDGCLGYDTVTIYVIDPDLILIPNLITPNGDNENDAWVLNQLHNLANYDITITNYAGKVVFQTSNYQNDWNATEDGKELPEGIYYYLMENRKGSELFKGFIQVIR